MPRPSMFTSSPRILTSMANDESQGQPESLDHRCGPTALAVRITEGGAGLQACGQDLQKMPASAAEVKLEPSFNLGGSTAAAKSRFLQLPYRRPKGLLHPRADTL